MDELFGNMSGGHLEGRAKQEEDIELQCVLQK
jgi:hypothetical protein